MPIEMASISHRYSQGRWILTDVNLEIDSAQSLAVVGPSGSGKTTLLSILGLLQKPTAGDVIIDGQSTAQRSPSVLSWYRSRWFSWVFQSSNVLGRRSVFDNVALGALSRGRRLNEIDDDVMSALDKVGLGRFRETPVYQLSGGELQRVTVARALAADSPYLLADEPTGQLDSTSSAAVASSLTEAVELGVGLVVATHDLSLANRCRTVVEIVDGVVVP